MKKGFVSGLLMIMIASPAFAKSVSKTKAFEKECKAEGLMGADLKACVKEKVKEDRKKKK